MTPLQNLTRAKNAQITKLQIYRIFVRIKNAQTKDKAVKYTDCKNFKMLVTSHQVLVIVRCVLIKGSKRCNIFLCTPCTVLDWKGFVRITIYFSVPHAMSFANKCHLCKIIEFYKDQGCQSHKIKFLYFSCLSLSIILRLF